MIHHYINLVCWREMLTIYNPKRDFVWVDSYILHLLVRRYRCNVAYKPGTSILGAVGKDNSNLNGWFFFTAVRAYNLPENIQVELPFLKQIFLPDNVKQALQSLPVGTRVGLGISAPKQNHLAVAMHLIRPDLEYHCLGASIDQYNKNLVKAQKKASVLSGTGFEWVWFLIQSPRRTSYKIILTICEAFKVRFINASRKRFIEFVSICKKNTNET